MIPLRWSTRNRITNQRGSRNRRSSRSATAPITPRIERMSRMGAPLRLKLSNVFSEVAGSLPATTAAVTACTPCRETVTSTQTDAVAAAATATMSAMRSSRTGRASKIPSRTSEITRRKAPRGMVSTVRPVSAPALRAFTHAPRRMASRNCWIAKSTSSRPMPRAGPLPAISHS